MFRVLLKMDLHDGVASEFERIWQENTGQVAEHPANLGRSLSYSDDAPQTFFIVSDWIDEKGFRDYERSAEHLAHRALLHPYRAHGSITFMNELDPHSGRKTR